MSDLLLSLVGFLAIAVTAGASSSIHSPGSNGTNSDGHMEDMSEKDGEIAKLAAAVLAEELGLPVANITVDSVRPVQWRNSSIGCPQPGEAYLQVITPGHKILLRVDGKRYAVHEAHGRAFVCKRRKDPGKQTRELDRS